MDETVNTQETTTQEAEAKETKTFTQDELNKVVSERVKKERAKYEDYASLKEKAENGEAAKMELQKATERAEKLEAELNSLKEAEALNTMKSEISQKTGVPVSLLIADNEEDCKTLAKGIIEFAKTYNYPLLKDSGEIHATSKNTTSQQFADWIQKKI